MSSAAGSLSTSRPPQNWIISRNLDIVFVIAAPVLAFFWALGTMRLFSTGVVLSIFMIFNVAHHFPTFIRIYGDRDLLRRFRWELILGPIIPFSLAIMAVSYVITSTSQAGQTAESVADSMIFLFIVLLIWDPWHFLMQHYGFMRIYDRHNKAPRKIAARMDLAVSWIWFICILVLISEWLPDLLFDLQSKHGLPLVFLFNVNTYRWLETITVVMAGGMGLVYTGYLVWCARRGYYISRAKLWLLASTFIVMYLTYVPNPVIDRVAPGWNFSLGFATLGMVHVTQYLAIVWKYNRGLATKNRARTEGFARAFARGGFIVLAAYLIACLVYGVAVSFYGVTLPFETWNKISGGGGATLFQSPIGIWYGGILAAVGFTSTFLHYYYDGFIWKVRHKENQQNLALSDATEAGKAADEKQESKSWWTGGGARRPARVLVRQALYLGVPIVLVVGTYVVTQEREDPEEFRQLAFNFQLNEKPKESVQAAEIALRGFERKLALEQKMIQIRPRVRHYASIAELTYSISYLKQQFLADVPAYRQTVEQQQDWLVQSIEALEAALELPPPYGLAANADGRERKLVIQTMLAERRAELAKLIAASDPSTD
jgi:hypothetical protein